MNQHFIKLAFCFSALASSHGLIAEMQKTDSAIDMSEIDLGSFQPVSQAVRSAIEEKRLQFQDLELSKNPSLSSASIEEEEIAGSWILDLHRTSRHHIIAVGDAFDTIRFEDESLWQVAFNDRYKIASWMMEHRLYLEPNWNSAYHYKIVNYDRTESVLVNCVGLPNLYSKEAHRVIRIETDRIILNDGTSWKFASFDNESLSIWTPGDLVIIGVNKGFYSFFYDYIIYNFTKDVNLMAEFQN